MTHFKCFGTVFEGKSNCRSCTPVVVIDPEDREAVKDLAHLIDLAPGPYYDRIQAALREFANPKPPKPEEPKAPGAVVKDAYGVRWVSFRSGLDVHDCPWERLEMNTEEFRNYADISVVTVLFEGDSVE